jgi:hypothetical protein
MSSPSLRSRVRIALVREVYATQPRVHSPMYTEHSLSECCLLQQGACGTLVLLVSLMATCALCTFTGDCDGRRGGCCTLARGVRRAFDLRDSFYQLSAPRSKKNSDVLNLDVINGMRTLSMVFIILGHTYLCVLSPSTIEPID